MTIRIAVMSAVLAAGSIAFSQTTSSAPASAPAVVADLGELAELPGALNLDDKAVALLREKLAQKKDALTKFMKEVGPAWSKAMSDATADDAKQAAEATAVLKKCQAQWDTFGAEQDAKVFSILTPEQRLAWDQHSLYRAMVRQFSHTQVGHGPDGSMMATLTEPDAKSLAIIKEASSAAAKELQALPNPYDAKARKDAIGKLTDDLKKRVQPAKAGGEEM